MEKKTVEGKLCWKRSSDYDYDCYEKIFYLSDGESSYYAEGMICEILGRKVELGEQFKVTVEKIG